MYSMLSIFIGILISIMISFNSRLEINVGLTYSLIIIHIFGLVAIIVIMLFKKERLLIKERFPIYLFLGGSVGVALTLANIVTISAVGVALTTSAGVLGQLIFSSLVDHYGLFGMNKYEFKPKK